MKINIIAESINQINGDPIEVIIDETDYPISPMVFAEDTAKNGIFKVRIMVYIPSAVESIPWVRIEHEGEPILITIEGGKEVLARSILVEYAYESTSTPPLDYNLWEILLEYSIDSMTSVNYILTRLRNLDPKTSRGTVTSVQDPIRISNIEANA